MRRLVSGTTNPKHNNRVTVKLRVFESKKVFLAARQRTKEIHTKRGRRLCEDETMDLYGQRLALSGLLTRGGHIWGGGDGLDRGVVATRGREKIQSSGRAGTLFRLRAYTKISRPKHKRAVSEGGRGTTKAEEKFNRTQKNGAGHPGTLCGARRPVRRVFHVVAYHIDTSCVPPVELWRAGWPRNTLRYLGVFQTPPQ